MSKTAAAKKTAARDDSVDAFLATLDHPHKRDIEGLRAIILDADPRIADGIKWNAPSYRTSEYFATTHLRAKSGVQIILHLGAKKRDDVRVKQAIVDPAGLLQWLADDRASVTFRDAADIDAKRLAFQQLLRDWIAHV